MSLTKKTPPGLAVASELAFCFRLIAVHIDLVVPECQQLFYTLFVVHVPDRNTVAISDRNGGTRAANLPQT
jgi:hypothetical protein